jgi:pyruvate ferredoxin oxidoreductase alpha subunit
MAFKLAEQLKIPVMVNVDGYVMTHTYEPVIIPEAEQIKKYLPDYAPAAGQFLDPENPVTFGALATPLHYLEIRQELHEDLVASLKTIEQEYIKFKSLIGNWDLEIGHSSTTSKNRIDNGLLEYTGPKSPDTIIVAMGSVIGTIKDTVWNCPPFKGGTKGGFFSGRKGGGEVGILKIKCFRPFPAEQILKILKPAKNIAVVDKSISLGHIGTLASEIKSIAQGKINANISSFIVGLGGRDITKEIIQKIIKLANKKNDQAIFIGK